MYEPEDGEMFSKVMPFVHDRASGLMNSLNLLLSSQALHNIGSPCISPLIEEDIMRLQFL